MNCTPPDSIYIWASISLFPLESSEQSAYMEIKVIEDQMLAVESQDIHL